jgi:hypothetical protein
MQAAVDKGYKVTFWPEWIEQKDINAMIVDGKMSASEVMGIIDKHASSGLSAKLELTKWKRI